MGKAIPPNKKTVTLESIPKYENENDSMVHLYFHYIHDVTCQKADWLNSQLDGQTLLLLLLQLPYESKKGRLLDLLPTLEWPPSHKYPVSILGKEDSLKGFTCCVETFSMTWGKYSCHRRLSTAFHVKPRLWNQGRYWFSDPFTVLALFHHLGAMACLHFLENLTPLPTWGISCISPCISWSSCFNCPFPPSLLGQLYLMLLSSATVSSSPKKLRFPLFYLQALCSFPS